MSKVGSVDGLNINYILISRPEKQRVYSYFVRGFLNGKIPT